MPVDLFLAPGEAFLCGWRRPRDPGRPERKGNGWKALVSDRVETGSEDVGSKQAPHGGMGGVRTAGVGRRQDPLILVSQFSCRLHPDPRPSWRSRSA